MDLGFALVHYLALAALFVGLMVASVIDALCWVIPNACVALVALGGVADAAARGANGGAVADSLMKSFSGAVSILAITLLLAKICERIRGDSGIGGGDIKLLSAAGLWTGPALGLALLWAVSALVLLASAYMCVLRVLSGHKTVILEGRTAPNAQALAPMIFLVMAVFMALGAFE